MMPEKGADETVSVLRALVGFDTTSHRSNLALMQWVADRLDSAGARVRLSYDDTGEKANLLASFGPEQDGGVLLSGHVDVVPVDGQVWSSDPFTLTEYDGRFFGRGAADMKGFVAACVAAASKWNNAVLKRPIHLAFTYDEEIGCFGAQRLTAELMRIIAPPALAIIGEPTLMRIGDRHRGFSGRRTEFRGQAAHSSDPSQGVSAIAPAAEFIRFLLAPDGARGDRAPNVTVNVGQVQGGEAINIVPGQCAVTWEFRTASAGEAAEIEGRVERFLVDAASAGVSVKTREIMSIPPLAPGEAADRGLSLIRSFGGEGPPLALPFGTEAGYFQAIGIPSVVCGPGSIEQAHRPDEWIATSELAKADRFMTAVGEWARSPYGPSL